MQDLEKRRQWHRDYKKMRRQKIKDYLGNKCVGCGTSENLQFDHIDRKNKKFIISNNVNRNWEDLTAEADKCQLLCKECHRIKSIVNHDCVSVRNGYKVTSIEPDGNDYIVRLSPM